MRRAVAGALLALFVSGCMTVGATWRAYSEQLQEYVGEDLEVMVSRFGAPDSSVDLSQNPPRVAHTWHIRNRGGQHVCNVTAHMHSETGEIFRVTDSCANVREVRP